MSKKQNDFSKACMLRLYKRELIDKLNELFNNGGIRYENKNHFLSELISAGIKQKQYDESLHNKLAECDEGITETLSKLIERLENFEDNIQKQLIQLTANISVIMKLLSTIYCISECQNAGVYLPQKEIDSGYYDDLPERFENALKEQLNSYERNS